MFPTFPHTLSSGTLFQSVYIYHMHTTSVYLILFWIFIYLFDFNLYFKSPTENTKHTEKNVGIKCKTDKYEKFEHLYKLLKHKLMKKSKMRNMKKKTTKRCQHFNPQQLTKLTLSPILLSLRPLPPPTAKQLSKLNSIQNLN